MKKIGSQIKSARLARGLTQAELADALDVSQPCVSDIESGEQGLTLPMMCRLASVLRGRFDVTATRAVLRMKKT